jgi:methylase of polypeptide subunit release factors
MIRAAMSTHPNADVRAAKDLGVALRSVGYTETAVSDLLGEDAYSTGPEEVPVHETRLPDTKLGTVVRLVFLGLAVPREAVARALGERGVEALVATELARVDGDGVVPRSRMLPMGDLLLAADSYSQGRDDPADYVAAYTPTTHVCDSLTPRRPVERALDVGTGSGAHAVLAAGHARHVVATDVNERALAYTRLNAALNGFDNVECRSGSLFEPAEGETFDLITCNAPYVVSPERRWAYRDAGGEADEVSEHVVRECAAHLADGGFATMLVSWVARGEDDADDRVLAWVERTGCDAWVLVDSEADPIEHAAMWNAHIDDDPVAYARALDEWLRYLENLGVGKVTDGAVVLHRREGKILPVRVDAIDEDTLEDAAEQVERAFAARARLAALPRQTDLLDERLSLASAVRLEHELEPGRRPTAAVAITEGTNSVVETTPEALEVVAALDGGVLLRDAVKTAARRLQVSDTATLERRAVTIARELLELGALEIR